MIKIAIEENDALYRNGLEILLKEIFSANNDQVIEIDNLDSFNVSTADIILKNYIRGMQFVCQPMLKRRKKNNLIIGVYEGDIIPDNISLPLCTSNIIFINRKESVSQIKEKILLGWQRCNANPHNVNHISCLSCRHRTLTRQQVEIAAHFYRGYGAQKSAKLLNINSKTVCAHKRTIMNKFRIDTDCDLLIFINSLVKNKYSSELFSIITGRII